MIKKTLSTITIIVLAIVGGYCFLIIKNAQPVNPVRAMTKETDFIRSGDTTDHIRAIEDKVIGSGRLIKGVDHTRLHIIGRYVEGQVFDDGVLTYQIKWPPIGIPFRTALEGMRVGGVRRVVINVQLLGVDWQHPSRFISFANEEKDDDSFRFRMDKGDVEFEIEILDACTPYNSEVVYFVHDLGCW